MGLTGCDTTPPQVTVPQPGFRVGGQIGPSERWTQLYGNPYDGSGFTYEVPRLLAWGGSDDDTSCQLTYSVTTEYDVGEIEEASHEPITQLGVTDSDYDDSFFGGATISGWRVDAHDCSGNTGSAYAPAGVSVVQESGRSPYGRNASAVSSAPGAAWSTVVREELSGGEALATTQSGATVSYTRTYAAGNHFGLVMAQGPGHGAAEVLVDGARVTTVNTYAPDARPRRILFDRLMTRGTHTVTVRNRGTPGRQLIEVDAFLAGTACSCDT